MRHSFIFTSMLVVAVAVAARPKEAAGAEAFRSGDEFVVSQQQAPLMIGNQTLATLSQGQRLKVLQTEGDWVGTSATINGRTISGWVHQRQVATPKQYAQLRTTRRRFSYQPAAPAGGYSSPRSSGRGTRLNSTNQGFIMGLTPYGPSYWRADKKIAGY